MSQLSQMSLPAVVGSEKNPSPPFYRLLRCVDEALAGIFDDFFIDAQGDAEISWIAEA